MVSGFLSLVLKLMGKSWLPGAVLEKALALPRGTEPMADQPRLMQAVPEKTQQVRQLLSARLAVGCYRVNVSSGVGSMILRDSLIQDTLVLHPWELLVSTSSDQKLLLFERL